MSFIAELPAWQSSRIFVKAIEDRCGWSRFALGREFYPGAAASPKATLAGESFVRQNLGL
ncbi:MAG: hypothetical protein HKL95_07660 [Phycisphaerae bacterium]|nr:hypothetical protein [Phycisphaerae bacterium]